MAAWAWWEIPLIAVGAGFHFAMAWALLWRYLQTRQVQYLAWTAGWTVLTLRVAAMLGAAAWSSPVALAMQHAAYLVSAMLFLAGETAAHPGAHWWLRPRPPVALAAAVAAGAILVALANPGAAPWARLLTGVAGAAAFAAAAVYRRRVAPTPLGMAERLLVAGFLLGAIIEPAIGPAAGTPWHLRLSMAGSAAFSLVLGAAMVWQAWEDARAVRLFQRVLETLNRPADTAGVLGATLDIVLEHLGFRRGWVLLRTDGRGGAGGPWRLAAARGFPEWAMRGVGAREYPIDNCLCLRTVDRGDLVARVNVLPCTRLSQEAGRPAGIHSVVPLGAGGRVHGIFSLVVPDGRTLSGPQLRLVQALGEQIGLALDRFRLIDELRDKEQARAGALARLLTAQEDERRRIARELHDEVGQSLSAIIVNLDVLESRLRDPALARQVSGVHHMVEHTLAEIHRVIHNLRPTVLDDLGLEAALRWLVSHHLTPAGLNVSLLVEGLEQRLPPALETTVFRVVQEASTNTVKHAGASHLSIAVACSGDRVRIEVKDDGRGFSVRRAPGRWTHGLAGLRERVALLDGTLEVKSAPGRGTRVRAELPLSTGVARLLG